MVPTSTTDIYSWDNLLSPCSHHHLQSLCSTEWTSWWTLSDQQTQVVTTEVAERQCKLLQVHKFFKCPWLSGTSKFVWLLLCLKTLAQSVETNSRQLHLLNVDSDQTHFLIKRGQIWTQADSPGIYLLSETQLQESLDKAAIKHSVVMELYWFYKYLSVTQLKGTNDSLAYTLEI